MTDINVVLRMDDTTFFFAKYKEEDGQA